MTGQLHHLIARQQIADAHRAASAARLVRGARPARRRVNYKPIAALLTVCGIACIVGASARAMPQTTKAPGAECRIRLPISLTADSRQSPRRRYAATGPAACTGWLGPWFSTGSSGSASSAGAVVLSVRGAHGCVPSLGRGSVFAVVPRQTWFVSPEVTMSGAFRFHRVDGRLRLTGHAQLVATRESPVSERLRLTGNAVFARRAGQACDSAHLRGTLVLRLDVEPA